jgi:glycosyltransferase involved in cell wall biosynthesis
MMVERGRRTRVCIVSPFQFGGGAEFQIDCLINVLVALNRYDIYFLARHTDERARAQGRYQVVKIGDTNQMPWLGYTADAPLLYKAFREIKPDVIYQRVACGYTGVCAHYARHHSARLIWHVASDGDLTEGGLGYGRNPIRRLLDKVSVRYAARNAAHIVVQKEQQAKILQREFGRAPAAIIRNFHPEPTETIDKSGPVTVVWVANLKRLKRPEAFVRLAQSLRDLAGVKFVMIGAPAIGDDVWRVPLERSIAETPNLEYVGLKSQAEVNAILARAHVFVNTSTVEGFANTFIQAWMRQVPVVTLDVNPDNLFDTEEIGFCTGSERNLAQAVRKLITDDKLRAHYARCSYEYGIKNHSIRNADRLVQLIDSGQADSRQAAA